MSWMLNQAQANWFTKLAQFELKNPRDIFLFNPHFSYSEWTGVTPYHSLRVYVMLFRMNHGDKKQVVASYGTGRFYFTGEDDTRAVELLKQISDEREENGLYLR